MLPALRKSSTFPGIVDEFFNGNLFPRFFIENEKTTNVPAVNIIEGKEDFRIEVAAPGLEKKDFKIDLENNVLLVAQRQRRLYGLGPAD